MSPIGFGALVGGLILLWGRIEGQEVCKDSKNDERFAAHRNISGILLCHRIFPDVGKSFADRLSGL